MLSSRALPTLRGSIGAATVACGTFVVVKGGALLASNVPSGPLSYAVGLCVGLGIWAGSSSSIANTLLGAKPRRVFYALAKSARQDRHTIAQLGGKPKFGAFRSLVNVPSSINWNATQLKNFYTPRSLHIAFELTGPKGSAIVHGRVRRQAGLDVFSDLYTTFLKSGNDVPMTPPHSTGLTSI